MKLLKFTRSFLSILVVTCTLLSSCTKDAPVNPEYKYYLADRHQFDITSQQANACFMMLQTIVPASSQLCAVIQSDVAVKKITYKTTFQGEDIQASGLVCSPKTAGNYPILCFQNGTNTLHSEAPSEDPQSQLYWAMESVASMGFIVVMPDYIGFGASANLPHPYLHAQSTVQSILDMLRAVKEFGTKDQELAKPTNDLFIFGYSQGGWSTMELQKSIETSYSSEFNLKASSCAAGPYSLIYMNQYIASQTDYPMPYFLAYVINAYKALGLFSNPLSDIIQQPYSDKISGLFDGMHSGEDINNELTTHITNLLTPECLTGLATDPKFSELRNALLANSITAWNISTPTQLYHGDQDTYIPLSLSQKMYADFKAAGVPDSKIELKIIPGFDHSAGVIPAGISTIAWFLSLK